MSCDDYDRFVKEFKAYNHRNKELDKINETINCEDIGVKKSGIFGSKDEIYKLLSEKSHYDIDNNYVILKYPNIVKCLSENLTQGKKDIIKLYGIDVTQSDEDIIKLWKSFYRENYKKQLEYIFKNLEFNEDYNGVIKNKIVEETEKQKNRRLKEEFNPFSNWDKGGGGHHYECYDANDKTQQILKMLIVNCNFSENDSDGYNGIEELKNIMDKQTYLKNLDNFIKEINSMIYKNASYYTYNISRFESEKKMNEIGRGLFAIFFTNEEIQNKYTNIKKKERLDLLVRYLREYKMKIEQGNRSKGNIDFYNDFRSQVEQLGYEGINEFPKSSDIASIPTPITNELAVKEESLLKSYTNIIENEIKELNYKVKTEIYNDMSRPGYTIGPITKEDEIVPTNPIEKEEEVPINVEPGVEEGSNEDVTEEEENVLTPEQQAEQERLTAEQTERQRRLGFIGGGKGRANKSRKNKRTRHLIKKKRNRKTTRKQVRRKHKTRRRQH